MLGKLVRGLKRKRPSDFLTDCDIEINFIEKGQEEE